MIIAQISDTHINLGTDDSAQRIKDFEAVVSDINALDPQPYLVVHTGDIVHNGLAEEYATAVEILNRLNAPFYALVGNKDNRANMRKAFEGQGYLDPASEFIAYMVDDFPFTLIMLDTLKPGSNKGDFCEVRMHNFEKMLEGDDGKPVIVFAHHPPFEVTVGPEPFHYEDMEAVARLSETLQKTGRVAALFCGHVHRSTNGFVGEIPATVMSAVATPLRWGTYPDHMKRCPVYQIHRYDGAGQFVTESRMAL